MSLFSHERKVHRYAVAGKTLACPQCSGQTFVASHAQLHTQGLTFFQLEWMGQTAHVLICDACSHIAWLAKEPEEIAAG